MNAIRKYFQIISKSKFILLLNLSDKLFSFIIFVLLARKFYTEQYGEVITLITLSTVFLTIYDFGLPIFMQREIAFNPSNASQIFSQIFIINLLIFFVYAISVSVYFYIFYPGVSLYLFIIISLMMYEASLCNICNKALSGINDFKAQFTSFWISRVFTLAFFAAGMYFLNFFIDNLMATMLIGFFLHLVLLFWFLSNSGIIFSFSGVLNFGIIKSILKFSVPLGMAVLFNFLYDKVDILLISKLKSFSDAAFYNVGYGIYKTAALSFSFILVSGFTRVSSISRSKKAVTLFFKKYFWMILIICLLSSIIVYFISGWLIPFIYTEKFNDSVLVLKLLSVGIIAAGLNNLTGVTLNGIGLFKVVMYITLAGLIINVFLNILFIPAYGILAASVITVITEYFILFFELYYLLKVLKIHKG